MRSTGGRAGEGCSLEARLWVGSGVRLPAGPAPGAQGPHSRPRLCAQLRFGLCAPTSTVALSEPDTGGLREGLPAPLWECEREEVGHSRVWSGELEKPFPTPPPPSLSGPRRATF